MTNVVATLEEHGAMDHTIVVNAASAESAAQQYLAPYSGVAMAEYFMERGQDALIHLRRPLQTRLGVPPDFPAPATTARPRGVPGRRLLSPLAPTGTGGQALGRERGRFDHRTADHRDAGRRRFRLHPDQRDLYHRRADIPRGRPVQRRSATGCERGYLRLASGRFGAEARDALGRRSASDRHGPVSRAAGVRPVRYVRPRRGGRAASSNAVSASRRCSSSLSSSRWRCRPRSRCSTPRTRASSTMCRSTRSTIFANGASEYLNTSHRDLLGGIADSGQLSDDDESALTSALQTFKDTVPF